jgi:hypothetical protein
MKTINLIPKLFFFILICLLPFSAHAQSGEAPNIFFTDLDGLTHDLHTYTDSGYKVILDFSYQSCNPCKDWAINVGHGLWEEHGPDGDNTIRMFHIDSKPATDQAVSAYTQQWGVEYPVINVQTTFPEYPLDSYPRLFYICADKSYGETGGYGYPTSLIKAHYYMEKCNGSDLSSNFSFVSASEPTSATLCNAAPLSYAPKIHVYKSDYIENSNAGYFQDEYEVQILINGNYHSTQTVNPAADGDYNNSSDESYLQPIPVNQNDELALVIDIEGDNFANDDTIYVTMPLSVSTPTSSSTSLIVEATSFYDVYDSNNEKVYDASGTSQFNLSEGSCYSIEFWNIQYHSGVLKDGASGTILLSFLDGDYEGNNSPRLYFNVVTVPTPAGITEHSSLVKIEVMERYYIDLLGKRQNTTNMNNLPKGIYFEIIHFKNGELISNKIFKK